MIFNIFKSKNKKEEDAVLNYLNNQANQVYNARKQDVLVELENDLQKTIFLDWWYGGELWKWNEENKQHDKAERYKHVNKHDWDVAHGWIMETISLGMG